jgi:hypothetical protein
MKYGTPVSAVYVGKWRNDSTGSGLERCRQCHWSSDEKCRWLSIDHDGESSVDTRNLSIANVLDEQQMLDVIAVKVLEVALRCWSKGYKRWDVRAFFQLHLHRLLCNTSMKRETTNISSNHRACCKSKRGERWLSKEEKQRIITKYVLEILPRCWRPRMFPFVTM